MKKKFLSVLLALTMVLSMLPATAFAADYKVGDTYTGKFAPSIPSKGTEWVQVERKQICNKIWHHIHTNDCYGYVFKLVNTIKKEKNAEIKFVLVNGTWNTDAMKLSGGASVSGSTVKIPLTWYEGNNGSGAARKGYVYKCGSVTESLLETFAKMDSKYITANDGYAIGSTEMQNWTLNEGGGLIYGTYDDANDQIQTVGRDPHEYDNSSKIYDAYYANTVYTLTLQPVTYTVEYDLDDGTGTVSDNNTYNHSNITDGISTITVSSVVPEKEDHTFLGWKLTGAGDTIYEAGDEISVNDYWNNPAVVGNINDCAGVFEFVAQWQKHEHTPGEAVEENRVEPNCLDTGSYDAVVYCTTCGEELSRVPTTIPANGHTPGEPVRESCDEPTCEEDGSYDEVVYCTVCGEELSRVPTAIPANGHTEGEAVEENRDEPTCTEDGSYDTVVYCEVCGEELSRVPTTIPANGHTEGEAVEENRNEPTCTEDGSYDTVVYCTVCEEELSREATTIDALGHNMGEWYQTKVPTFAFKGEERRDCQRENCDYYEFREIAKLIYPVIPLDPTPTVSVKNLNDIDHMAYVVGRAEGEFDPMGNVTRAEVATMYFRLMTEEFRNQFWSDVNSFSDVADTAWYNVAISTLENAGVIKDTVTGGEFRPNDPITRAELAVMAAQFAAVNGTVPATSFKDVPATHWAAKEIALVECAGWIEGYQGYYRPEDNLTRAECVTIINRMLKRGAEAENMLEGMVTFEDNVYGAWYYEAVQEAANSHDYTRTSVQLTGEKFNGEKWIVLLDAPDWAVQEKLWAEANK